MEISHLWKNKTKQNKSSVWDTKGQLFLPRVCIINFLLKIKRWSEIYQKIQPQLRRLSDARSCTQLQFYLGLAAQDMLIEELSQCCLSPRSLNAVFLPVGRWLQIESKQTSNLIQISPCFPANCITDMLIHMCALCTSVHTKALKSSIVFAEGAENYFMLRAL